eukprot:gene6135-41412_t
MDCVRETAMAAWRRDDPSLLPSPPSAAPLRAAALALAADDTAAGNRNTGEQLAKAFQLREAAVAGGDGEGRAAAVAG